MTEEQGKQWTVSRRIPLPSIIAGAAFFIGQTAFMAQWMGRMEYRVQSVEDFMKASQPQATQIAVMQEKVTVIQNTLNKIETFLTPPRAPQHQ